VAKNKRASWRATLSKRLRLSRKGENLIGGALLAQLHGQVWSLAGLLRHWADTGKDLTNAPLSLEEIKAELGRV